MRALKPRDGRDNHDCGLFFDNHTESNLLLRSLSRALYPDGTRPWVVALIRKDDGPLFGDAPEPEDIETGTSTCCAACPVTHSSPSIAS
jgi:hypothetical protein